MSKPKYELYSAFAKRGIKRVVMITVGAYISGYKMGHTGAAHRERTKLQVLFNDLLTLLKFALPIPAESTI